ncbi:MAG TPA: hypothetical protein VLQ67_10815 [Arachnia sp.]|nr:hypothetical protein [Arachnia sp.]
MTTHHQLPTSADLRALDGDFAGAVSLYVETSPNPSERERAQVALKSGFDSALRQLEEHGVDRGVREGIAAERDAILDDHELWGKLSRSLAVFVAPGVSEVFVLPNRLEDELHAGVHFAVGQLLRSISQPQEAFAITLSDNEWQLWHATPHERVAPIELTGTYPASASEATNRDSAGRGDDRLSGDVHDLYAKRVADAARTELARLDPDEKLTLFVFADESLAALFGPRKEGRRLVTVPGNPDRLNAAQIDDEIRGQLAELNVTDTLAELHDLGEGDPGRVERDLAAIAKQAINGAVDTIWFDVTLDIWGTLDTTNGALTYDRNADLFAPAVSDLLAKVALLVLDQGGRVVAVRGADLGDAWDGPALARLRY